MAQTIQELLQSMLTLNVGKEGSNKLENSKTTWEKIGNSTWAEGLAFSSESEKESFLKEWISENDYQSIA